MARYYLTHSTRARAGMEAMRLAKQGQPTTVYVVNMVQPPIYLTGEPTMDMEEAGATPLFTVEPGLGVRGELEAAKAALRVLAERNPPPCPAGCEDVGSCCFCDGTSEGW